MAGLYLDTSAVGRVLLAEPDGEAVLAEVGRFERRMASRLLAVELRRLALRHRLRDAADRLLAAISLVPLSEATLAAAESIAPASVATLDAIHLAAALELFDADLIDTVLTYDERLAEGARHHGLTVLAPSA